MIKKKINYGLFLFILIVLSVCVKMALGYYLKDNFFDRGNSHTPLFSIAKNLYLHNSFSVEYPIKSIDYEPLYPYLIFLAYQIFGYNWIGLTFIQAILLGISAYIVFQVIQKFSTKLFALIGSLYFLFYPYLFSYSLSVFDAVPFVFLLLLLIKVVLDFILKERFYLNSLFIGIILGLGMLARGSTITLIPPIIILIFFIFIKPLQIKRMLICYSIILFSFTTILTPWLYRNYKLTGQFLISTHGAFGLWQGNNPLSLNYLRNNISLDEIYRSGPKPEIYKKYPKKPRNPKETVFIANEYKKETVKFIMDNKVEFIKLSMVKFSKLWTWRRNPDSKLMMYSDNNQRRLLHSLFYLPLIILLPFGLWRTYNKNKLFSLFILSILVFYTLAHMVAMGFTRARIPIDPILIVEASIGLMFIKEIRKNKNPSRPKVILSGKLPPPYIGPSVATSIILNSKLKDHYELIHLDLSDHRDISTIAKLDFINFYLAFKQYFVLIKLIIKHKPALVYVLISQSTVGYVRDSIFIIISKIFGRKVLCHLRGGYLKNWYDSTSKFMKWYFRKVHGMIDGQIVLGNNLKHIFSWLIPEKDIFVVPNGGNFNINPVDRSNREQIRVLFLSNFIQSKGIVDVIDSTKYLVDLNERLEFIFAGSFRDNELKQYINSICLTQPGLRLKVIESVSGKEKYDLFEKADIFIFPTYYQNEGHPWVIVEAMAAGLPVITTNHAAIPESVYDGVNGYLVEKQNPHQIADKIRFLAENPEIRLKMGIESRKLYEENFTEEKMIEKLKNAFDQVINKAS